MRKLARIATGIFQVRDSHVWEGVLWFQNKDKLIKVTIGLTKPMREATRLGTFLTTKEAGEFPRWFKR
jgi:hypothetical protein